MLKVCLQMGETEAQAQAVSERVYLGWGGFLKYRSYFPIFLSLSPWDPLLE